MPKPNEDGDEVAKKVLDEDGPHNTTDDAGDDDTDNYGEDGTLEVDLEDAAEKEARLEKSRNTAFAAMRVENKALRDSIAELTNQVSSLAKPTVAPVRPATHGVPQTDEEWDALASKDWKKAVDLRSIQNAQNIVRQQQVASKAESTLEDSKQKVLSFHPEINDNNSEKARIFLNILQENPEYLTLPKGPLYAMRDMEDYMENTLGYKKEEIRTAERKGAEREASRQNRIILSKGTGRTNISTGNKIVLDKDEMEFCKFQGIDPKEYARNKQKLSKAGSKEGVTI
jgi:hypothetical protein